MNRIDIDILLNNTEVWTLQNNTQTAHPFHIHDIQFFILDINGNPPPAYLSGRKDVILVPPFANVRFITQFTDFASDTVPYMYHCHMLPHEDGGMMGQFVVRIPNGIKENSNLSVEIYPNPNQGLFHLSSVSIIKEVIVYNMLGEVVLNETPLKKEVDVRINASKGVYFLEVQSSSGKVLQKIVVQ